MARGQRAILLSRDPRNVQLHVPDPARRHLRPAQRKGIQVRTYGRTKQICLATKKQAARLKKAQEAKFLLLFISASES